MNRICSLSADLTNYGRGRALVIISEFILNVAICWMFLSIKKNLKPQLGVGEGVSYNPWGSVVIILKDPRKPVNKTKPGRFCLLHCGRVLLQMKGIRMNLGLNWLLIKMKISPNSEFLVMRYWVLNLVKGLYSHFVSSCSRPFGIHYSCLSSEQPGSLTDF